MSGEYPAAIQSPRVSLTHTPYALTLVSVGIVSFTMVMTFVNIAEEW